MWWWWSTRLTLACVVYMKDKVGLISTQAHASQFGGVPFILPPNQGVGISLQPPAACYPCVHTPYHDLTSICKTNSSLRKMIPQKKAGVFFPTPRPSRGCVNFGRAKQVLTGRIIEKMMIANAWVANCSVFPPRQLYRYSCKRKETLCWRNLDIYSILPLSCIFLVKTQKWSKFSIDSYFLTDS